MQTKHLIGYAATALVALGIGAASASGTGASSASGSRTTLTVTETAPGARSTVTETAPGAESTVTKPAPTVTVTAQSTKTVTASEPAPAAAMPGDGTYQVGVDVKAGVYKSTAADSGNCYWARMSGPDTFDDIIDNGNSSGQVLVTIKSTDKFFQSSGCNDWTRR